MDHGLFIQGIIVGLTLAVPVGPISLVCIHRTIAYGRLHGILSGFGVATSDSFYAAVAFLGLSAVSGLIIGHQTAFRLVAGIALVLVGIFVFRSLPVSVRDRENPGSYVRDYLSLLAITAANPFTIIFFITILPGFGIMAQGTTLPAAVLFVGGVFIGSATWWIILCGSIGSVRSHLSMENLRRINQVSGTIITLCGAGVLVLLFASPALLP